MHYYKKINIIKAIKLIIIFSLFNQLLKFKKHNDLKQKSLERIIKL